MIDIIKKNIKFIVAMLIVIILGIFGIAYALNIPTFNSIGIDATTGVITANITYDSTNTSTITSTSKMLPIKDSLVTGVSVTDDRVLKAKFMVTGVSSNPANSIYDIALRDINMSSALRSEYLKWRLYKNGTLLYSGNFSPSFDLINDNRMVLTSTQQDLTTSTDTYVFLMWISESCPDTLTNCDITKNQDKLLNKTFNASIKIEASTKTKKVLVRDSLSTNSASYTITNMFTPNKLVVNNSINYRYDTTNNLMEDIDGNIRYYGSSPNNYIYFNCSDYSNQTSDTCELWRIIGVFNGKVKIMRNSSIGGYSWDNKNTSTGAENDYGKNDWSDARLMKLLNSGYESESVGGSLYWNAGSGTCYSGYNNATTTCDFTSTGLKNATTRNLISESTWSLLGHNTSSVYTDVMYNKERTTGSVYSTTPARSTSWTGKVALAYPSDYGYAADLSQCNQILWNYDNSTCTSNNWMKSVITNNGNNVGWLLTPYSGTSYSVWHVTSDGYASIDNDVANDAWAVAPVLYLNSKQAIGSGDGSNNLPFQLLID